MRCLEGQNGLEWGGVISPRILDSARKHGISDATILRVLENPIFSTQLRREPPKVMVVGLDENFLPVEVGYVHNGDGTQVVIHAMPAARNLLNTA